MEELVKKIEELGKAHAAFVQANDARLKEIESKGNADPLLEGKVDKVNAEITTLTAEIDKLNKEVGRIGTGGSAPDQAKGEHAKAFNSFLRKGKDDGLSALQAAISTDSDPDGGFLVPEEIEAGVDRVATQVSALRGLARVMSIGSDTWKKLVGVGGAGSGWVGEKSARTETNTPTLVEIAINTKELYANPAITQKALDDAAINVESWLAEEVGIEFAEKESAAFISGNGVEQPKGILAYTTVANASYAWGKVGYIAGGHASLLNDMDKLIDLEHALKSVYRNGAVWLMNDSTFAHIRKFKDGEGQYIWRPGLDAGAPNTILGKPVAIDDNMDSIGSGKFPIAFANFGRAYTIVDRVGVRVLRDPYTNKPYVHFYTTKRVGGGITQYEAIKLFKVSAS